MYLIVYLIFSLIPYFVYCYNILYLVDVYIKANISTSTGASTSALEYMYALYICFIFIFIRFVGVVSATHRGQWATKIIKGSLVNILELIVH